ncbi:hypothetical protein [Burkholderia plantarii]|uniref:hypothetical protein n=1 Tax=Burkholderia plantarii TaxID=41899 RepID=UPI000705815F|nr:hypothetical protein [Burkholderia plantarii]ALK29682.1 hypothetical protein bpln_1g08600 [Burkholderia plantarii]GLZ20175.1 hypothetical protein Bpla01_37040 [Burkholderia plantarii]
MSFFFVWRNDLGRALRIGVHRFRPCRTLMRCPLTLFVLSLSSGFDMSLAIGNVNGSDGIDTLGAANSAQSQLIQLLQQIENAIHQLLAQMSSDDNNKIGGGPSGAGGGGGGMGGGFPQLAAQPAGASAGTPAAGSPAAGSPAGATPNASTLAVTSPAGATPGATTDSSAASGAAGLSNNAGGVAQAAATNGVSPNSVKVVNTGTGDDKTFNVTNNTNREQSFTYSVQGQNKGTITLEPGQTGSFTAGSGDIGVRISPSDASGNTHPDEVLYEDGGADNGQASGAGNPDISKVDGNKDFGGQATNMTVTMSDGRTAGDGDAIHAYQYSTDDAASMGLAGDPSKTANIVLSDA